MRRRDFVSLTGAALASAALPGCASFVATPVTPVNGEIRLVLRDHPQLGTAAGYLKLRPTGSEDLIYVLAGANGEYAAVSSVCTHLQCTVNIEGTELRCPCHGSTFDRSGAVVQGPAMRPLRRFPVTVSDGALVIAI
jgi:Rieske Fe-S protein